MPNAIPPKKLPASNPPDVLCFSVVEADVGLAGVTVILEVAVGRVFPSVVVLETMLLFDVTELDFEVLAVVVPLEVEDGEGGVDGTVVEEFSDVKLCVVTADAIVEVIADVVDELSVPFVSAYAR